MPENYLLKLHNSTFCFLWTDSILFPEVPIALRLSSHLLLGVVRIYSRKVGYLFDDCSEALLKVKQAFRSTAVDLPPEESTAPYHSITLPETFDLDDFELPDNEILQGLVLKLIARCRMYWHLVIDFFPSLSEKCFILILSGRPLVVTTISLMKLWAENFFSRILSYQIFRQIF